jgi:hypothetical protein
MEVEPTLANIHQHAERGANARSLRHALSGIAEQRHADGGKPERRSQRVDHVHSRIKRRANLNGAQTASFRSEPRFIP